MTKEHAIQTTFRRWMREPFAWGKSDCMLSVADYLIEAVGVDCGCRFRGRYSTMVGCARVSGFHRDPVKPFADCVAEIPLTETAKPKRGDVGVVEMADTTVGAICMGKKWVARDERGLVMAVPSRVLKAWGV
jgi:hypothetical protein